MKAARQLIREMELWKLVWQQVETFVDRIDGARDADNRDAERYLALMLAATVIERERSLKLEDAVLGDPVAYEAPRPNLGSGWAKDHRIWRLPGTDELEIAVANLYDPDIGGSHGDPVELLPPRDFYSYRIPPSDPAFEASDNGVVTVRVPGYPGKGAATIAGTALSAALNPLGAGILRPEIKEDGDIVSLFSPDNRGNAATDVDQGSDWIQTWSDLAGKRRNNRSGAAEADVKFFGASGASVAWSSGLANAAISLALNVKANHAQLPGTPAPVAIAVDIATAATGAASTITENGALLQRAAEMLEDTGTTDPDLPGLVSAAANGYHANPDLFRDVADAANDLSAFLAVPLGQPVPGDFAEGRGMAADALFNAVVAIQTASANANALFEKPVEESPLATEINDAAAARIGYPDGSLRMLRALEGAFVRFWPARMKWFSWRYRLVLQIAFTRFRAPFLVSLRALLDGGDTGFPVAGLSILAPAPIRSAKLRLDHPASFTSALSDVEAGQIVLTTEGRAAAAVVLGVSTSDQNVALDIDPLRIGMGPDPAGGPADTPGQITGGQEISTIVPGTGLSTAALELGAHPTAPRLDGPVETAVILYGQLALLFGWRAVETGLSNVAVPDFSARSLPDASDVRLRDLTLHGAVPANTMTLVIRGASDAFWDRSQPADPLPRLARPGERLLIRGRAKSEDGGAEGPMMQAVLEVDQVYATTVRAFYRMDATSVALLSTTPLPSEDLDVCLADCAPEDHLIVVVLSRTWQRFDYVADITLRRDFPGFDLPSLATGKLLPAAVVEAATGALPEGPADLDRSEEFEAAKALLADWTRFARK